ncbi:MAG: caspase family protein [Prosthecobacter sp.]
MKPVLLFSLLFACAVGGLAAAERVALVIGNNEYAHADKLKTAVSDSQAVAAALEKLDFETIVLGNAGLDEMMGGLLTLRGKAEGAKVVLVYFAGHGIEARNANYLLPVDAQLQSEIQLKKQTVSLSEVLDEVREMAVPACMVILDCCRNNPLRGRSWLTSSRSFRSGLAPLKEETMEEATLVIYSASPGKPALDRLDDKDKHSPFTQALLEELPKPGVHSFEVFGRVEESVLTRTGHEQKPRIFYNGSTVPFRTFTFAREPAAPVAAPPVIIPAPPAIQPAMPAVAEAPPPTLAPSVPAAAPAPPPVVTATPAAATPALPASGYFDLETVYGSGPYSGYNRYSRSQILKQAQQKFKTAGHYGLTPDGESGPGTQRAIISYQEAQKLPVTGRLDAATLESLGLQGQSQMKAPEPARDPKEFVPKRLPPPERRPAAKDDFFRDT